MDQYSLESARKSEVLSADLKHVMHPLLQHQTLLEKPPLIITAGKGATIYDADGHAYLDAMAGLWCVNIGYGRLEVADAAHEQLKKLAYYPHTQANEPAADFAAVLAGLMGPRLRHVYFVNSGTEANEAAFKIARQYAKLRHPGESRHKILGRYLAYHGTSMSTLAAGGVGNRRAMFEPLDGSFLHAPPVGLYRDPFGLGNPEQAAQVAATYLDFLIQSEGPESICAMILEPIPAAMGVLIPPPDYLRRVQEICRKYGILLICDEVINGFGRTGSLFAHQLYGLEPDIVTIAKGITSAYLPLGATVVSEEVFQTFLGRPEENRHIVQINTYGGHPASCAAGLKNVEILLGEEMTKNSRQVGTHLIAALRQLDHDSIAQVRGSGLLAAVELVSDRSTSSPFSERQLGTVVDGMKARGVLVGRFGSSSAFSGAGITLSPPLCLTLAEADRIVDALDDTLSQIATS